MQAASSSKTSITTLFVTPNHPSYPSAHPCLSSAMGSILSRLFPAEASNLDSLVDQIGESRLMGGIHYRNDMVVGNELGRQVADVVWTRANETSGSTLSGGVVRSQPAP